jgi:hypothetical protein
VLKKSRLTLNTRKVPHPRRRKLYATDTFLSRMQKTTEPFLHTSYSAIRTRCDGNCWASCWNHIGLELCKKREIRPISYFAFTNRSPMFRPKGNCRCRLSAEYV